MKYNFNRTLSTLDISIFLHKTTPNILLLIIFSLYFVILIPLVLIIFSIFLNEGISDSIIVFYFTLLLGKLVGSG